MGKKKVSDTLSYIQLQLALHNIRFLSGRNYGAVENLLNIKEYINLIDIGIIYRSVDVLVRLQELKDISMSFMTIKITYFDANKNTQYYITFYGKENDWIENRLKIYKSYVKFMSGDYEETEWIDDGLKVCKCYPKSMEGYYEEKDK